MFRALIPSQTSAEEQAEVASALGIILWTLMAASLLLILGGVSVNRDYLGRAVRIFVALDVLCLPTFILIRRGLIRFASVFTVLWLWAAITFLALTAGGIFALASFTYVIIVFIAGLLLGARAGIVTALLCIATALVLVVVEVEGHLPTGVRPQSPIARWIGISVVIFVMMSLQYLAARTIREALLRTQKELEERKRAEASLKASEALLRALSAKVQFAREEEGTRIAREIHDELGSSLTGLKWDLEKMDKTLSDSVQWLGRLRSACADPRHDRADRSNHQQRPPHFRRSATKHPGRSGIGGGDRMAGTAISGADRHRVLL